MSSQFQAMLVGHLIAAILASMIVGCGAMFCAEVRNAVRTHVQEQAETWEQRRLLDQGNPPTDFGTEMPPDIMRKLTLADILYKWRYIWITIVYVGCLGTANCVTYQ
jgi:hypothetical protein